MIELLYVECDIISRTVSNLNNFKSQTEFGIVFRMIKCYTTMKVDTPKVKKVIEEKMDIWNHFFEKILKPHVERQDRQLGKVEYQEGT